MRNIKIFLVIFILLSLNTIATSQDFGTTGATFLKLGAGTRAVGMGSAFTGLSDDVNAIYWNPAGLGFIRRWELGLNYQKLFNDFEYYSLFYSHQFSGLFSKRVALGIGLLHLGITDNWDSTNGQMPSVNAADVSDLAVILPFAYRLDFISEKLSIGMNYKYIQNRLAGYTSHAHGVDLGILFRTDISHRITWSAGAAFQNKTLKKVKFIESKEGLPYRTRLGTAIKLMLTDNQDFILSYDLSIPKDDEIKHNMGFEYWLHLGAHRMGLRGGYRALDEDLGKLSFSVGYGFDIGTVSQGTYYSEMDYALNNYNTEVLGNANTGGFIIRPTGPEPFKRLSPKMFSQFKSKTEYLLTWQKTSDCDEHQRIKYFVAVDTSYAKLNQTVNDAKKIIKNLTRGTTDPDLLFYRLTQDTKARFTFEHETDVEDFYWAVIAYNRSFNTIIATGSDIIGKFSNRNLPDLIPLSIQFEPVDFISNSKYQGTLSARIVGKIEQPCEIALYDSTDSRIICSEIVSSLAPTDTFKFGGKWIADKLGKHKICLITDFKNNIEERDENNNILTEKFNTILYGKIAPQDTIKLEELRYENIELPTIPYVFFEAGSVEFSAKSKTKNETEPDSLLKLFGKRLRKDYPGLKIVLKGFVDLSSEPEQIDNKKLSTLRSLFVKQKLIEYGARESQVVISTTHNDATLRLERRSRQVDPAELFMLNEENRRVEIQLPGNLPTTKRLEYDKRFFAPRLILRKKNEILSEKIVFNCEFNSSIPLDNLTIHIRDNEDDPYPIKVISYNSIPETENINFDIEWDGIKDNGMMIAFNKSFFYWTTLIDKNGKRYESPMKQFYIERDIIVKEKRIFALAKFNKVAPLHEFYLEQLDQVEAMMKKDPRIRVRFYGHTDVIGTEERNNDLSSERAMELANWLAKIIDFDYSLTDSLKEKLKLRIDNPLVKTDEEKQKVYSFGKGENYPLVAKNIVYGDNDSPQGRTLNRRVDIEIYRKETYEKPPLQIEKNITFHPWYQSITFPKYAENDISELKVASGETSQKSVRFSEMFNNSSENPILLASTQSVGFYQDTTETSKIDSTFLDSVKVVADTLVDSSLTSSQTADSLKQVAAQNDTVQTTEQTEEETVEQIEIDPVLLNRVHCIEFQDSLLWLGTDDGLLRWDAYKDTFDLFQIDFIKYKMLTAIEYDQKQDFLYVGTQKGLRIFDKDGWKPDFNVWNGLSGNMINDILVLDNSSRDVLLATNEGINIIGSTGINIYANMDFGLTDDFINSIYKDDNGKLWACTNKGLCLEERKKKWAPFSGNESLPSDTVKCMIIDNDGNKWIGTVNGLCKFDRENNRAEYSTFDYFDKIRSKKIISLSKDNSGKIWCATKNSLSMLQDGVWYSYNYEDGLPSSYVNAVKIDNLGRKY
ncbi:hypothetical protein B6I21_05095, partial [candidate division KSB1 bacterium 4572_119]